MRIDTYRRRAEQQRVSHVHIPTMSSRVTTTSRLPSAFDYLAMYGTGGRSLRDEVAEVTLRDFASTEVAVNTTMLQNESRTVQENETARELRERVRRQLHQAFGIQADQMVHDALVYESSDRTLTRERLQELITNPPSPAHIGVDLANQNSQSPQPMEDQTMPNPQERIMQRALFAYLLETEGARISHTELNRRVERNSYELTATIEIPIADVLQLTGRTPGLMGGAATRDMDVSLNMAHVLDEYVQRERNAEAALRNIERPLRLAIEQMGVDYEAFARRLQSIAPDIAEHLTKIMEATNREGFDNAVKSLAEHEPQIETKNRKIRIRRKSKAKAEEKPNKTDP